jgi:hypothetical protein
MGFHSKISYNTLMEENQQSNPPSQNHNIFSSKTDEKEELPTPILPDEVYLTWSATEFIENQKPASWYMLFIVVLIVISAGVYLIIRSIFPVIMIVLIGIVFGVVALRKPKEQTFELNNVGLLIGKRASNYSEFKSFSVIDEKGLGSIVFNPFKRFVFPTTIYYDIANEEKIVGILSDHLPMEEPTNDPIENLMRKVRF